MGTGEEVAADAVGGVVDLLRSGTGVELRGLPGSGRSRLLESVVTGLRRHEVDVLVVRGRRSLRERPFAALALAGVEVPPSPPHAALFAALAAEIGTVCGPGGVLVVDDADDLDEPTTGVLAAVSAAHGIPVLASRRPRGAPGVADPWPVGVRVPLPALGFEALHTIVLDLLPGAVDPTGMARLIGACGGLPGLLRTVVLAGRAAGAIVSWGPVWRVGPDVWSAGAGAEIDRLTGDLDEEELDVLTTIAAAEVTAGAADVPPAVVRRLYRACLLAPTGRGSGPRVFPPLLGEHLRRGLGLEPSAGTGAAPASDATPERLRQHWAAELSERRAAWLTNPTATTAGPLLAALHQLSAEPSVALEVLAGTAPESGSPADQAGLAIAHALYVALGANDIEGGERLLAEESERLPASRGILGAVSAHVRYLLDAVPPVESVDVGEAAAEDRTGAQAMVRAEGLVAQGRIEDARESLTQAGDGGWISAELDLSRGLAALLGGEPGRAIQIAAEGLRRARQGLDGPGMEATGYLLAFALEIAGSGSDLQEHLASVLAIAQAPLLQRHLKQGTLALAAADALGRGRPRIALSLVTQSAVLGSHDGPLPGMTPSILAPVVAVLRDPSDEEALAAIWRTVVDRLDRGYVVHAVFLAVWAAQSWPPPTAVVERLAASTVGSQSPVLRVLGGYLEALGTGDGAALESAERALHAVGLEGLAVPAGVAAAVRYRHAGDTTASVAAASRAWERMLRTGAGHRESFRILARDVELTAREEEIARLAVAGVGNAELARTLSLSVRTVESHISNALRKVGVDDRDGLRVALDTWLGVS